MADAVLTQQLTIGAAALALLFLAVLAFAVVVFAALCMSGRVSRAEEAVATSVWDENTKQWVLLPPGEAPGPAQFTPRQIAELDELALALAAPAFDPATDPQWAAGRERLLADLNDQGDLT